MILALTLFLGANLLSCVAGFFFGRLTAPRSTHYPRIGLWDPPHQSVTDMALDHRYRLSEGAESNVVQLRREG